MPVLSRRQDYDIFFFFLLHNIKLCRHCFVWMIRMTINLGKWIDTLICLRQPIEYNLRKSISYHVWISTFRGIGFSVTAANRVVSIPMYRSMREPFASEYELSRYKRTSLKWTARMYAVVLAGDIYRELCARRFSFPGASTTPAGNWYPKRRLYRKLMRTYKKIYG